MILWLYGLEVCGVRLITWLVGNSEIFDEIVSYYYWLTDVKRIGENLRIISSSPPEAQLAKRWAKGGTITSGLLKPENMWIPSIPGMEPIKGRRSLLKLTKQWCQVPDKELKAGKICATLARIAASPASGLSVASVPVKTQLRGCLKSFEGWDFLPAAWAWYGSWQGR